MLEENKLLKYLSMALPYGVIVRIDGDEIAKLWRVESDAVNGYSINRFEVLPYLRPISSMTDEEVAEYNFLLADGGWGYTVADCCRVIDWLLKHHFDFMGLIKKGLALETKEGMYEDIGKTS